LFVCALTGNAIEITNTNSSDLLKLSEELGFTTLRSEIRSFPNNSREHHISDAFAQLQNSLLHDSFSFIINGAVINTEFAEAIALSPAVREQLSVDGCARKFILNDSRSQDLHSLQFLLSEQTISVSKSLESLARLLGNVDLERLFVNCSKMDIQATLSKFPLETFLDLESEEFSMLSVEVLDVLLLNGLISVQSEDALLRDILKLGPEYHELLKYIQIGFLSKEGVCILDESFEIPSESVWQCAIEWIAHQCYPFDSQIIPNIPKIFAELHWKSFKILWRGSRDGFGASDFHRLCDGHVNTLTVILDTNGNIFGGFTPLKWESWVWNGKDGLESNCWKADDSLKTFIFTLKNPYNVPPVIFPLKYLMKHEALECISTWGPHFCDIGVADYCNSNTKSYTRWFPSAYINTTGLNGSTFFTGSEYFTVKEIEVFEITH
jgi:hypothetical protein